MGRLLTTRQYGHARVAVMKPSLDGSGYYRTMMDGKTVKVHRIVGENWLSNPLNLPVINHINGNRTDNRAENLEWATIKYNAWYGIRNGSIRVPKSHNNYKFKKEDREAVRILASKHKDWFKIAKALYPQASQTTLYRWASGKSQSRRQNLIIPSVCEEHHTHIVSDENIVI